MFTGTTPPEVRLLLGEIIKDKANTNIYIGCSGNYTIDRLASFYKCNVYSNDVSLYSKLIADILLNRDTEIKIVESGYAEIFRSWPETIYKKLIFVMYLMKIAEFSKQNNDYKKTFYDYYIEGNKEFYLNTVKKFERTKCLEFKINDFFYGDFITHIRNKKGSGIGILFPPTYKGGYEKIFKFVDDNVNYKPAPYEMFDPSNSAELFNEFLTEDENIIYSDRDFDLLEKFKIGEVNLGQGKHNVFIYSSVQTGKSYYMERKKKVTGKVFKIIPENYEFTEKTQIRILPCKTEEVNYYKAFFMSSKVNYTLGGDFGIMFFADEMLFGLASFSKTLSGYDDVFVQSDFVVNSKTRKLSKLLLFIIRSEEIRSIVLDKFKHYYQELKTSVFTDKPVSMKYRGVFNIKEKQKGKIIYTSNFVGTLKENFELWLKKKNTN